MDHVVVVDDEHAEPLRAALFVDHAGSPRRDDQAHLPDPALALAEFDHAAALQRLERSQP